MRTFNSFAQIYRHCFDLQPAPSAVGAANTDKTSLSVTSTAFPGLLEIDYWQVLHGKQHASATPELVFL